VKVLPWVRVRVAGVATLGRQDGAVQGSGRRELRAARVAGLGPEPRGLFSVRALTAGRERVRRVRSHRGMIILRGRNLDGIFRDHGWAELRYKLSPIWVTSLATMSGS
jgi:hypothetical protein